MQADEALERRYAWIDRILDAPPAVHPEADNGAVWSTARGCYRFMAQHVAEGSRTLETGAGISTALFAAWGCEHLAVVPSEEQAHTITEFCSKLGIGSGSLHFDLRPSEVALPELAGSDPLDLVFIDGCHGFPIPMIDWFYGAGRLGRGGVVVFDDLQLPQVNALVDRFVDRDARWLRLAGTKKWVAYRRLSEGPLGEEWTSQSFFAEATPNGWTTIRDSVVPAARKLAKRVGDSIGSTGPK